MPEKLPAWVAYDRKVLRFYCYFKENIHESTIETNRIRRCVLFFYLEDDSIHIAEPRIQNSGIPQGVFIKRHRVAKPDGTFYSINDLRVGADLPIYGRCFHLVDCDDFTRVRRLFCIFLLRCGQFSVGFFFLSFC